MPGGLLAWRACVRCGSEEGAGQGRAGQSREGQGREMCLSLSVGQKTGMAVMLVVATETSSHSRAPGAASTGREQATNASWMQHIARQTCSLEGSGRAMQLQFIRSTCTHQAARVDAARKGWQRVGIVSLVEIRDAVTACGSCGLTGGR